MLSNMCKKLGSCAIIHSNSWDLVVSWTLHWHVPVLQNSQRGLNFLRKLCKKKGKTLIRKNYSFELTEGILVCSYSADIAYTIEKFQGNVVSGT